MNEPWNIILSERSQWKTQIVWFHLYAMFRRDKSIKMENSDYPGQGELEEISDW